MMILFCENINQGFDFEGTQKFAALCEKVSLVHLQSSGGGC
jgi:hypothetical protein